MPCHLSCKERPASPESSFPHSRPYCQPGKALPGLLYRPDMFPHTPAYDLFPCCVDIHGIVSTHVETVVLLSQQKADDYIEIDLDLDEMDITSAETKATYREVQQYVLQTTGLMVSNLNIAQIKDKCGFDKRENYNKPRTANSRQPKCTPEKEKAIMDAFRHFGMI